MTMSTARTRKTSLDGCLANDCRSIHHRIEDDATTLARATGLLTWTLAAIADPATTRAQAGLLATAAARILRRERDDLRKTAHKALTDEALRILAAYPLWQPCDKTTGYCDQCARTRATPDEKNRPCRFVQVPRSLVWTTLYDKNGDIPTAHALAFLTAPGKPACGVGTTYKRFAKQHPDAAMRDAAVAIQSLRRSPNAATALAAVERLWATGVRTPETTEAYAALVEDNLNGRPDLAVRHRAIKVCDTGMATGPADADWSAVLGKRGRLERRVSKKMRAAASDPYNKRDPWPTLFVKP